MPIRHLMLRADVIEACAAKQFAVYAVAGIDEGIELLTGTRAGQRNGSGLFPENRRIEKRLREFANVRGKICRRRQARRAVRQCVLTTVREFRRALLGLNVGVTNAATLDVTTRIADFLGLDLLGLYFLDDALTQLALYTGMREFSLTAGTWRTIDPKRLRGEQEAAVWQAERLFKTNTSPNRTRHTFKVVADRTAPSSYRNQRPRTSSLSPSLANGRDSLPVRSPSSTVRRTGRSPPFCYFRARFCRAGDRWWQFAWEPDDRSMRMAETVAAAAGERLVVIEAFAAKRAKQPDAPQESEVPTRIITAGPGSRDDPQVLAATLGSLAESPVRVRIGAGMRPWLSEPTVLRLRAQPNRRRLRKRLETSRSNALIETSHSDAGLGRAWTPIRLDSEWIGVRQALEFGHVELLHGTCSVDPDVLVELLRQNRLEVVAGDLAVRPVNHADRTLNPGLGKLVSQFSIASRSQRQQ